MPIAFILKWTFSVIIFTASASGDYLKNNNNSNIKKNKFTIDTSANEYIW